MSQTVFTPGSVELPDGRRLAVQELGGAQGFPVLYLHGAIGSPLVASPELLGVVARLGLRWVCVSRPGFGGSDALPGRRLLDFPADVAALARARGWRRLAIVGVSTGGPYALACGSRLAELAPAVAVSASLSPVCAPHEVRGLAPVTRIGMRAFSRAPRTSMGLLAAAAGVLRTRPRLVARVLGARRAPGVEALRAATAYGVAGLVADYRLCCEPWGFEPGDVRAEVHLWHGVRDQLVPVEHAWQLAASLPHCRAAFDPDADHFFFRRRIADIVTPLVARAAHPLSA